MLSLMTRAQFEKLKPGDKVGLFNQRIWPRVPVATVVKTDLAMGEALVQPPNLDKQVVFHRSNLVPHFDSPTDELEFLINELGDTVDMYEAIEHETQEGKMLARRAWFLHEEIAEAPGAGQAPSAGPGLSPDEAHFLAATLMQFYPLALSKLENRTSIRRALLGHVTTPDVPALFEKLLEASHARTRVS